MQELSTFEVALPGLSSRAEAVAPHTIQTKATAGMTLPSQITSTTSGTKASGALSELVTIHTLATNGSPKPNQESFSSLGAFPDDLGPLQPRRRSSGLVVVGRDKETL